MNDPTMRPPTQRRRTIRDEFANLPNLLTYGRIVLIAPVLLLMLKETPEGNFWAAVLFGVAAITDWMDGWLARRSGLVSVLGKLLDPLADKLIVMATLVIAAQLQHIPGWFVVLLLSRELFISGLRSIASQEGLTIDVIRSGKVKTALQLVGLVALIVHFPYEVNFGFTAQVVDFGTLGVTMLALSMVFSVLSAGIYVGRFTRAVMSTPVP